MPVVLDGVTYNNVVVLGFGSTTGPTSGKSFVTATLRDYLYERLGVPSQVFNFAGPLKRFSYRLMRDIWGIENPEGLEKTDPIMVTGEGLDEEVFTVRDLFILAGMAVREEVDKDFWVDACLKDMAKVMAVKGGERKRVLMVDDVRFRNEVCLLQGMGGKLIDLVDTTLPEGISRKDSGDVFSADFTETILNRKKGEADLIAELERRVIPYIRSELQLL